MGSIVCSEMSVRDYHYLQRHNPKESSSHIIRAGSHRVATQLQLINISYHIISYHIISYHIISYHIIYHIISYHIISYHIISYIISYHIISYHIISYHIISYHVISYHIISYHIISYHIISYHIISYHIISYHIISYHIISYIISYHTISYIIISYIISYIILYQTFLWWIKRRYCTTELFPNLVASSSINLTNPFTLPTTAATPPSVTIDTFSYLSQVGSRLQLRCPIKN